MKGIDQSVLSLQPNSVACDKYLQKVQKLLEELISFTKGKLDSFPTISKMREFLKTSINCDIGEEGLVDITKGMIECALDIEKNITEDTMNSS